ncbi:MAG: hypothetical protein H8D22_12605 [Candidatus Cloacimonetes bacterium]|nr:hypothetical protein [Candidatus Cloacimonadota bacterium]
MKNKVKCIELRTNEGKVILSLYLYEKEIPSEDNLEASVNEKTDVKKEKSQKGNPKEDDSLMTDAQKRYLFRILAGNGLEADEAHEKLKELFQVDSLKDVTKVEASNVIEKLLEESKGEKDDRAPF